MEEDTVPTEARNDVVDRRRSAFEETGDLAVGHAVDGEIEDLGQ